jgi:uncharacterized membrane protein YbhN (UPF0104 family)
MSGAGVPQRRIAGTPDRGPDLRTMRPLSLLLFPDLQAFGEAERAAAMRSARSTPLDFVELAGIALALVLTTAITRYGVGAVDLADRIVLAAANFIVAVPLLALFAGPFLVRRVRRGLREQLARRTAFGTPSP